MSKSTGVWVGAIATVFLLLVVFGVTYLWTKPSYACVQKKYLVDVVDTGNKDFKGIYDDGTVAFYNDSWAVRSEICTNMEIVK